MSPILPDLRGRVDEKRRDVVDRWKIFLTSRTRVGYKRMAVDETRREGRAVCSEVVEREHGEGDVLAVDANVHRSPRRGQLEELMRKKNMGEDKLVKLEKNLVDLVWEKEEAEKRPGMPKAMLRVHAMNYAGKSTKEKLTGVRKAMEKEKQDCLVVSALDDVMWLMNVRGGDAECNPVCLSHVLVTEKEAFLFVGQR